MQLGAAQLSAPGRSKGDELWFIVLYLGDVSLRSSVEAIGFKTRLRFGPVWVVPQRRRVGGPASSRAGGSGDGLGASVCKQKLL